MELKEFLRDALVQIVDGALEAHRAVKSKGAAINPGGFPGNAQRSQAAYDISYGLIEYVEFDVALTDSEKQSAGGGIGVFLGSFGLGGKTEKGTEASSLTRIKFRIPLGLPKGE